MQKALIGTCEATRLHIVLGSIKLYARIDYYHALLFKSIFIWDFINYYWLYYWGILRQYFTKKYSYKNQNYKQGKTNVTNVDPKQSLETSKFDRKRKWLYHTSQIKLCNDTSNGESFAQWQHMQ